MAAPPQNGFSPQRRPEAARLPKGREWLLLGAAVLILLAVVLPPLINLGRYQRRVVDDMSRSLGRRVGMRRVSLRLLPSPALVLSEVAVYEQTGEQPSDPAGEQLSFGAEPILRAPSLVAQLRLGSLWRGRLEVSRVDLSEASLNLVRNGRGHWNVNSILLQAAHVPNAPTAQRHAGPASRFPYISMTDSRINFKNGAEKLPFSLTNAQLSMWLAGPDLWQFRLEAQPVRTDLALGLADTGLVRAEAQIHRTPSIASGGIGNMPLTLHAEWSNAPLGQATRLLLGRDGGWRGDLEASADATGELNRFDLKTHLAIANLHREEFTPAQPFSLDASCRASYDRAAHTLDNLLCRWPVDQGQLLLSGRLGEHDRALNLDADHLPANFLAAAAGLARDETPPTVQIDGTLAGTLRYTSAASPVPGARPAGSGSVFSGSLDSPALTFNAAGLDHPLLLSRVRLAASTPAPSGVPTLTLTADPFALGAPALVTLTAQLTETGFLAHVGGQAAVKRLEELGRAAHLLPPALAQLGPAGLAEFDLTRSAGWLGQESVPGPGTGPAITAFAEQPTTGGWLRLSNVVYNPTFLPEGVPIASAQAVFSPGLINWTVPAALFHRTPVQVSASYPLHCKEPISAAGPGCVTRFRLSMAAFDTSELGSSEAAGLGPLDALRQRFASHPAAWPPMAGTLRVDTFTIGRMVLHQAAANLSLSGVSAHLDELQAHTLGGELSGSGSLVLDERGAHYKLDATLANAAAAAAGALMHENWGSGTLSATAHLELTGAGAGQLESSAKGSFEAEWLRGALGSAPVAPTPFRVFPRWTAAGTLADGRLRLTRSQVWDAAGDVRTVAGSIGLDRSLDLRVGEGADSVTVVGTVARPIQ